MYQENLTRADIIRAVQTWADDLKVRSVDVDRSTEPVLVEVVVARPEEPPNPGRLAELAAEDLKCPVLLEVSWAPMTTVEAPAP